MTKKDTKNFNNYKNIIDNVLKISMFCENKNFADSVCEEFYKYFCEVSNLINVYEEDETIGVLCAIIHDGTQNDTTINFDNIKVSSENERQYIEFRRRIKQGYKSMYLDCDAELEFFSSIKKGLGIGQKLIECFHEQLKQKNIIEYHLFTNEMCDYKWYMNHGYEIIKSIEIDISDLNHIFHEQKTFKLFLFKKSIND